MPILRAKQTRPTITIDHTNGGGVVEVGEYYKLVKEVTWQEQSRFDAIQSLRMDAPNMFSGKRGGGPNGPDDRMNMHFATHEIRVKKVATYLVEWSHLREDGRPLVINEETVQYLTPPTIDVLLSAIEKLEDEQAAKLVTDEDELGKDSPTLLDSVIEGSVAKVSPRQKSN